MGADAAFRFGNQGTRRIRTTANVNLLADFAKIKSVKWAVEVPLFRETMQCGADGEAVHGLGNRFRRFGMKRRDSAPVPPLFVQNFARF